MILGSDGAKLSKRHGAVDIRDYKDRGYLPKAMLNYLVRLGWSHGDQEIFSVDEMTSLFDISEINQSASAFNPEKLLWINQQHIIRTPTSRLGEVLVPFLKKSGLNPKQGPDPALVAEALRERATTLVEMAGSAHYFYADFSEIDGSAAKKYLRPVILEPLRAARDKLARLPEWTKDAIAAAIEEVAASFELNMGKLGQPIRVAVTGGAVSPPIDVTVCLVGRERALSRLDHALEIIQARAVASS